MMMSNDTARYENEIPQVRSRSGMRVWKSTRDDGEYGICKACDLKYRDKDGLKQHMQSTHPYQCCGHNCRNIASYKRSDMRYYHHYCVIHADEMLDADFSVERVTIPANEDAPRLPDDHPIEVVLQGLEVEA